MNAPLSDLWASAAEKSWRASLDRYETVVSNQSVAKLPELDGWYRNALPEAIRERGTPHITHDELVRLTEWKMARGVWRAPNLVLVKSNDPDIVRNTSSDAFAKVPHATSPVSALTKLDGVGPATASAAAAAFAPEHYPFFDELVAAQVPALGKVAWTLAYYARYASALRERSTELGSAWTPVMVERALWSHVGGKAGIA